MSVLLLIAATTSPITPPAADCRARYIQASAQNQQQSRDQSDSRRKQATPKPDRPARPCLIMAAV